MANMVMSAISSPMTDMQSALDTVATSNDKRDQILVDLLKAMSETRPELLVKYMDFIARNEDENKK